MLRRPAFAALSVSLALASSCRTAREDRGYSTKNFTLQIAVDENVQLSENTYPKDTCIPILLTIVGASQSAIEIKNDVKVGLDFFNLNPEDLPVERFADSECLEPTTQITIQSTTDQVSTKPSTIYVKSTAGGIATLRVKYDNENWSGSSFRRLNFK